MTFPAGVLFDLDGTLVDSAPDFVATIAIMAEKRGLPPVTLDALRPHVSKGSRAMLAASFTDVEATERESWVPEFLDTYEALLGDFAPPFVGVEQLLATLDRHQVAWGIVTNKPEYLAVQVLDKLNWTDRCKVLIGGDTLPQKKPDPLPLLVGAQKLSLQPAHTVYVGDDERDIIAANAAGMPSIAALWGYRLGEDDPANWNATLMLDDLTELFRGEAWPKPA